MIVAFVLVLALIVVGAAAMDASTSARQDGTPSGSTPTVVFPIVPAASECTVPPRPFATFPRNQSTPATTPLGSTPIVSMTAPMEAEEVVLATMRIYLACVNAGDLPRVFTMVSDAYLAQLQQQAGLPPLTDTIYQQLGTPVPLSDIQMIRIQALSDVQAQPDGSIRAQIVTVDLDTTTTEIVLVPSPESPTGYVLDQQILVATVPGTPIP
jgi:hypothetical protein